MDNLKDILFSDKANRITGDYTRDEFKADDYIRAVAIVNALCQETGAFAYRADDVNEPLYVHAIEIQWFSDEVQLEAKRFANLFANMQYLNLSKLTVTPTVDAWLFTSEIYKEV